MPLPSAEGHVLPAAFEVWGAAATLVGPVAVLEVDALPLDSAGGEPMLISDVGGDHDVHGCWGAEELEGGVRRLTFVAGGEVASARLWLWCEDTKAVEVPAPVFQMVAPVEPPPTEGEPEPVFESIFDREQLETGAFEPPVPYEGEPWPAEERHGTFAALDLRQITHSVQRQHLPALLALAAAFIAFLVIAFTGVGPTTF